MGAWGAGVFDDDAAMDAVDELLSLEDPRDRMKEVFLEASEAVEVDYENGCAVLVAASIIDAMEQGPGHLSSMLEDITENELPTESWEGLDFGGLKVHAVNAVRKVIDGDSELRDLWQEGGSYTVWADEPRQIMERLSR